MKSCLGHRFRNPMLRFCCAAIVLLTLNLSLVVVRDPIGAGYLAEVTYPFAGLTTESYAIATVVGANNATPPSTTVASFDNATKDEGLAIAVVITLTKEPPIGGGGYLDGAAVLAHSIRTHIQRGPMYRKVDTIVLCGPNASDWSSETFRRLKEAGWIAKSVDVPVSLDEIQGEFYREKLPSNGCCGEKELIKLHALTLDGYDRVLLLDADSLLLQPIDELLQEKTDAVWTYDAFLGRNCINGGFLISTPSKEVFSRLIKIIRKGDYREESGWAGENIGWCFGGMTFQGLIPYYYMRIHPSPVVPGNKKFRNVDNCVYNNFGMGKCLPDKRITSNFLKRGRGFKDVAGNQIDTPIEKIKTAHMTGPCKKPFHDDGCGDRTPFCVRLADKWWLTRYALEQQHGVEISKRCQNGRYTPLKIFPPRE